VAHVKLAAPKAPNTSSDSGQAEPRSTSGHTTTQSATPNSIFLHTTTLRHPLIRHLPTVSISEHNAHLLQIKTPAQSTNRANSHRRISRSTQLVRGKESKRTKWQTCLRKPMGQPRTQQKATMPLSSQTSRTISSPTRTLLLSPTPFPPQTPVPALKT
jgi:hypothetical protein